MLAQRISAKIMANAGKIGVKLKAIGVCVILSIQVGSFYFHTKSLCSF